MNSDQAEVIGIKTLGWLAGQEDLMGRFLGMSGIAAEDLRKRARSPEFLGFVLDFMLTDDAVIIAFCADTGLAEDTPMRARAALPGGDIPNWT